MYTDAGINARTAGVQRARVDRACSARLITVLRVQTGLARQTKGVVFCGQHWLIRPSATVAAGNIALDTLKFALSACAAFTPVRPRIAGVAFAVADTRAGH